VDGWMDGSVGRWVGGRVVSYVSRLAHGWVDGWIEKVRNVEIRQEPNIYLINV
jgi:hypothetical protein